jgi:TonB-dependent SusC/RagA subfamily outer membrane receptor
VLSPDEEIAVGSGQMSSLKGELRGLKIREKEGENVIGIRTPDGMQPLLIVDGKRTSEEELQGINPKEIKSIDVLKNETSTFLYGEDGKNGVVLITMKKPAQHAIISTHGLKGKPLIVVDEKKMPADFELNTVNPDKIESISILKDKSANEIYGDEGKNGVIIIKTK